MVFQMLLCGVLIFTLTGCAMTKKNMVAVDEPEIRISELEKKVQEKDDEIHTLQAKLEETQRTEPTIKKASAAKATTKQIQTALKNAGFYSGPVDGKIGQMTKTAVKEFQKANGLKEDGVVGQQTWSKLSEHFE